MPKKSKEEKEERSRRERAETPSIFTAAGLISFYEEEEAKYKVSPTLVILVSIAFISAIALLHLIP